jgi:hydrogenase nickel incorporation protein HypA/HybF
MHEMSIVEALLEEVSRETRAHPTHGVQSVRVRVGALRQVQPEILSFCYNASVRGTPLEQSRLEVQMLPAEARCRDCGQKFPVEENWFECPRCGTLGAELLQGNELELVSIEIAGGN